MLPKNDAEFLAERFPAHQVQMEGGALCVVIPNFPMPGGLNVSAADLLLRLMPGYPDLAPDMWWFDPMSAGATVRSSPRPRRVNTISAACGRDGAAISTPDSGALGSTASRVTSRSSGGSWPRPHGWRPCHDGDPRRPQRACRRTRSCCGRAARDSWSASRSRCGAVRRDPAARPARHLGSGYRICRSAVRWHGTDVRRVHSSVGRGRRGGAVADLATYSSRRGCGPYAQSPRRGRGSPDRRPFPHSRRRGLVCLHDRLAATGGLQFHRPT
nr:E2/UBC family protein [Chenggangzhangella methanolivorans]